MVSFDSCSNVAFIHHVVLAADVGSELEETIKKTWPDNIVKLVRSTERLGLIRARLAGADAASGDVLVFLDAHCEVNVAWYLLFSINNLYFCHLLKCFLVL